MAPHRPRVVLCVFVVVSAALALASVGMLGAWALGMMDAADAVALELRRAAELLGQAPAPPPAPPPASMLWVVALMACGMASTCALAAVALMSSRQFPSS
jgi:hypothetical protein